jgi:hypothetical protein
VRSEIGREERDSRLRGDVRSERIWGQKQFEGRASGEKKLGRCREI